MQVNNINSNQNFGMRFSKNMNKEFKSLKKTLTNRFGIKSEPIGDLLAIKKDLKALAPKALLDREIDGSVVAKTCSGNVKFENIEPTLAGWEKIVMILENLI